MERRVRSYGSRGHKVVNAWFTERNRKWASLPVAVLLSVLFFLSRGEPVPSQRAELDLRVISGTPLEQDYSGMVLAFLLRRAEQATQQRRARLSAISSPRDLELWQEANRRKFLELIGGLPPARGALNSRVLGELRREDYQVRKVVFESLPEFYVTANLYVPARGSPPFPAVLAPVGHAQNGKAYATYQRLFVGLAKRGYVVLTYDPLGQGERLQYWDFFNSRRAFDFNQHAMAGLQQYLLGQNLARYFVWDGMRALDYLTSLPEVDSSRIGCTGSSGGGTLTTYISMLDSRIRVASIVTFITTIPKKIEARHLDAESDPEQDIQGLLAEGIDHTELVGMIAPRPVLIGAATRDFFPIEGTRQTFAELERLYLQLGYADRIRMVEFDHGHTYSQPLREATAAWFDHWLRGVNSDGHEPSLVTESEETLQCTPTGQVITSWGGRRISDFNRVEAERLISELAVRRRDEAFLADLRARIRARLALPSHPASPRVESLSATELDGLYVEKLLVEPEAEIVVPVRILRLASVSGRQPAVVYLSDRAGEPDALSLFDAWARQGRVVAIADVRGFGETWAPRSVRETAEGYYDPRDGVDADFTYASFFLGRPLLGMRVWDALNVLEYLRSRPEVDAERMRLVARGWAAPVAAFAAAVDTRVAGVAVEGMLASYAEIALADLYDQPASLLLPGVIRDFDLADVLGSVAPRRLLVVNPLDPLAVKFDRERATQELAEVSLRYQAARASGAFQLRAVPIEADAVAALARWVLEE